VGFAHRPPGAEARVGGLCPPYNGSRGAARQAVNLSALRESRQALRKESPLKKPWGSIDETCHFPPKGLLTA
jgi:hypothetical protein